MIIFRQNVVKKLVNLLTSTVLDFRDLFETINFSVWGHSVEEIMLSDFLGKDEFKKIIKST